MQRWSSASVEEAVSMSCADSSVVDMVRCYTYIRVSALKKSETYARIRWEENRPDLGKAIARIEQKTSLPRGSFTKIDRRRCTRLAFGTSPFIYKLSHQHLILLTRLELEEMPRQAKQPERGLGSRTLVVDNGGHTIKAGFVKPEPNAGSDCRTIPNCIARSSEGGRGGHKIYIADQLEQCKDFGEMSFRRPVDKGFIVNWDSEMDIWKQSFFKDGAQLNCDARDTNIILTEAPNCPAALQTNTDQILFEEFDFASAYRCQGS